MAEVAVTTKSAALALMDERALMRQGYQFLDEKRMLLAAEMLRRLKLHEALSEQLAQALLAAQAALKLALQRHGLEGLQAYPPAVFAPSVPALARSVFLGVPTWAADFAPRSAGGPDAAIDASPEARACREAYIALLAPLAQLAASSGNLERLAAEYRRTERRAKALENVLLPEVEHALSTIEGQLELGDQEEAVRIRLVGRHR
jgi:V/A-type H+/Na+-transporting ATPase subunit D